jgi:Ni/Co efflux regulator RcnB
MFRVLLIAIAVGSLSASPALSQLSQEQQKQIQKRESSGEAASQVQRGGLKRDRQISQQIFRNSHARMRTHHYRYER